MTAVAGYRGQISIAGSPVAFNNASITRISPGGVTQHTYESNVGRGNPFDRNSLVRISNNGVVVQGSVVNYVTGQVSIPPFAANELTASYYTVDGSS